MIFESTRIEGMAFVAVSVVFEALGQLAFKRAADRAALDSIEAAASLAKRLVGQRAWIGAGIACFVIEGALWTLVLKFLPVSIAHPAGSLELVVVALLARLFFRERLSPQRWLGVGLILAGVITVGVN